MLALKAMGPIADEQLLNEVRQLREGDTLDCNDLDVLGGSLDPPGGPAR